MDLGIDFYYFPMSSPIAKTLVECPGYTVETRPYLIALDPQRDASNPPQTHPYAVGSFCRPNMTQPILYMGQEPQRYRRHQIQDWSINRPLSVFVVSFGQKTIIHQALKPHTEYPRYAHSSELHTFPLLRLEPFRRFPDGSPLGVMWHERNTLLSIPNAPLFNAATIINNPSKRL